MSMLKGRTCRSVSAALALVAALVPAAWANSRPHIAARPDSVMVNTTTELTGRGFAKHSEIVLSECASETWTAPQKNCLTANQVTVKTNGAGAFKTSFKALLCEGMRGSKGPTEVICYVGEIHPSGIDTIELLGAVQIAVTYP